MVLVDVIRQPLFSFYYQRSTSARIIICGACTRHSTSFCFCFCFFSFFQANNFVIHEHFFSDLQGTLHSSHSLIHSFLATLRSTSSNSHFPTPAFDYTACFHLYSIPAVGYVPRRSQRLAQNSFHTGRPPVHPYRRSSKDVKISWIVLFSFKLRDASAADCLY